VAGKPKRPIWKWWLLWVPAHILGFGVGFGVARVAAFTAFGDGNWARGEEGAAVIGAAGGTVLWAVFGAVVGTMQWFCLRRHISGARWWLVGMIALLSVCGAVVHGYLGKPWLPSGKCVTCGSVPLAVLGAMFGMITGFPLLGVLRRLQHLECATGRIGNEVYREDR